MDTILLLKFPFAVMNSYSFIGCLNVPRNSQVININKILCYHIGSIQWWIHLSVCFWKGEITHEDAEYTGRKETLTTCRYKVWSSGMEHRNSIIRRASFVLGVTGTNVTATQFTFKVYSKFTKLLQITVWQW